MKSRTVKVEVDGTDRRRTVVIERDGERYRVLVDGQPRLVDLARAGSAWSLVIEESQGVRRSVQGVVRPLPGNGAVDVYIDGIRFPSTVRRRGPQSRGGQSTGQSGPERVTAPMPGKVVRVLIAAGQHVTRRQGLLVVEAMKMENEIRATRDGQVREVLVSEGQSVEAGTALAILE
jgi:acetyl/propionyl-CoA carboxylase alpha subunit